MPSLNEDKISDLEATVKKLGFWIGPRESMER